MKSLKIIISALLLFGFCLAELQAQTVKDIDGNTYKTVTIGTQIWMAENLKTTKFNDGTSIPLVSDSIAWQVLSTPGYCWYNNDEKANNNIYGALYNWHTVNTGKLCPSGWHVPSDDEWKTLTTYLGGAEAGDKLQEKGTIHWVNPNPGATNESGFTALPAGLRIKSGTFVTLGHCSYWWTSTGDKPEARYVGYYDSGVERGFNGKQSGLSVRCVLGAALSITTSNATILAATPVVIKKNEEPRLTASEQKPMELVTIRNEAFRFEVTTPKSWSFSKMVQQDPYEEMKSGSYSSSLATGDSDKIPENWNGFNLVSTGESNDSPPFLIIYGHKVADQKPEDFAKLFESSLSGFGIKEINLNRTFSVGDATGFDCIYGLGIRVRYTALYRNGIRVIIHYYFPSNDPALFEKYAPEVDKVIRTLSIK